MIDCDYMILRLFVLRIGHAKNDRDYKIAYGVVTPSASKMSEPVYTDFTQIGNYGKRCSVSEIKLALESNIIIAIHNDLLNGFSVKTAFDKWGVNTTKLVYDVKYSLDFANIPWSEESIADYQLNYTKVACLLDPALLFNVTGVDKDKIPTALSDLVSHISKRTYLSTKLLQDRIGNLEIIVAPARDVNGRSLIECTLTKGSSFTMDIKVLSALSDKYDSISVNVRITTGGRVTVDELCCETVTKGVDTLFSICSELPVGTSEIKIWGASGGKAKLIHRAVYHYIQQININAEIIGERIKADTDWLQKIRANASEKQLAKVEEASMIVQKSSENHVIGDKSIPLWLKRKTWILPVVKSNDEYFPKGWDNNSNENGRLSFLEWFKRKANGATNVFMQDPYFEDVALFFLASAGSDCDYTVLTQTHLKTNPDGTDSEVPEEETPERQDKIIRCILQNPTLFNRIKLVVKDIPVADNKLHDRYIFFSYSDGKTEAYTLSNSIQGSTTKQPLLITQIGDNAFRKLRAHLESVLENNHIETIYDYRERRKLSCDRVSEVADPGFLKWVAGQYKEAYKGNVKAILDDAIQWNTTAKISTLGYCLANLPETRNFKMIEGAVSIIKGNKLWRDTLVDFVLKKHYSNYPIGFIGCPDRCCSFRSPSYLLEQGFNEIVSRYNLYFIEYAGMEGCSYRVWGQHYACEILAKASPRNAIKILKLFRPTLISIEYDKQITPIFKVTNMLINALLQQASYKKDYEIMDCLLSDDEEWCRALGCLLLVYYSRDALFDVDVSLNKISNQNELIQVCKVAWSVQNEVADIQKIYERLVSVYETLKDGKSILQDLATLLQETYVLDYKLDFILYAIKPLISKTVISTDEVCSYLIDKLYAQSISVDKAIALRCVLASALNTLDGDFSALYSRASNTIEKFKKEVRSMVTKDDNSIFIAGRELINLRNLLLDLLRLFHGCSTPKIIDAQKILKEVDEELDKVGLQDVKLRFE